MCIRDRPYIGVRSCVIKKFALFRGFDVGSDVGMKYEIQSEFIGHFFGIGDNSADVLPLDVYKRQPSPS